MFGDLRSALLREAVEEKSGFCGVIREVALTYGRALSCVQGRYDLDFRYVRKVAVRKVPLRFVRTGVG